MARTKRREKVTELCSYERHRLICPDINCCHCRLRERKKSKEKRAHARANNIDLGPSRKALKKSTMAESSCRVTMTVDMSFDDLMQDKDIAKLTKQILRCYSLNRRAASPVQFSLTGFQGKSKQEMQKYNGYEHWDVRCFIEAAKKRVCR